MAAPLYPVRPDPLAIPQPPTPRPVYLNAVLAVLEAADDLAVDEPLPGRERWIVRAEFGGNPLPVVVPVVVPPTSWALIRDGIRRMIATRRDAWR